MKYILVLWEKQAEGKLLYKSFDTTRAQKCSDKGPEPDENHQERTEDICILMSSTTGPQRQALLPSFHRGKGFILPCYHKNLKGCAILYVLESLARAINTPSIIQFRLFICLFLRTQSSCDFGNWVLQDLITAMQRVNETRNCRQSWRSGKQQKIFKKLWHKVLLLKGGNQSSPMNSITIMVETLAFLNRELPSLPPLHARAACNSVDSHYASH